jgi:hypothetical protein
VGHVLPLAFLAPEIVSAILTGTHPVRLTASSLRETESSMMRRDSPEQRDRLR